MGVNVVLSSRGALLDSISASILHGLLFFVMQIFQVHYLPRALFPTNICLELDAHRHGF